MRTQWHTGPAVKWHWFELVAQLEDAVANAVADAVADAIADAVADAVEPAVAAVLSGPDQVLPGIAAAEDDGLSIQTNEAGVIMGESQPVPHPHVSTPRLFL